MGPEDSGDQLWMAGTGSLQMFVVIELEGQQIYLQHLFCNFVGPMAQIAQISYSPHPPVSVGRFDAETQGGYGIVRQV